LDIRHHIIIIIIIGMAALCEPWPSSELFAILPYCRSLWLLLLWISKQLDFCGLRLLASRPNPTWKTRVSLFVWLLPLDLSGLGGPTSSYTTTGIALRVSGALKLHDHDKVGIASVAGHTTSQFLNCMALCRKTVWFLLSLTNKTIPFKSNSYKAHVSENNSSVHTCTLILSGSQLIVQFSHSALQQPVHLQKQPRCDAAECR
jgi:hypothetical protein